MNTPQIPLPVVAQRPPRFWIGVASRGHVQRGMAGGFCQLCHGKAAPLARMAVGDGIVYYSPKEAMDGTALCQHFTAIGVVVGAQPYRVEMAPGFVPHRRDVRFLPAAEAPIRPLIDALEFITDKARWGYAFRWGHLQVLRADFVRIAQAMQVSDLAAWSSAVDASHPADGVDAQQLLF